MSRLDDPGKGAGLKGSRRPSVPELPTDAERGFPLLRISELYLNLDDLVAADETKERIREIVAENESSEKLLSYGLRPKNRILLCGPPGTGKTLTARIIGNMMGRPTAYVAFDSVTSSYLGETASNLRKIFDFIESEKLVVLFDEFDIVGKKRDDPHEHGEIKRLVNNFMQLLDNHAGPSIIIAATNHQQLLDTAVWRRFDDVIHFGLPDRAGRIQLFEKYLRVLQREDGLDLGRLARLASGFSAADVAQVCQGALKRCILGGAKSVSLEDLLRAISEQKKRKKAVKGGG